MNERQPVQIVLLEDSWQQAETIEGWLKKELSNCAVRVIDSERAFESALADFEKAPPDVFILDMMVRYTDPDSVDDVSPDCEDRDFFTAGARCYDQLEALGLQDRALIYSVVDEDDLKGANLEYLLDVHAQKDSDDWSELARKVQQILNDSNTASRPTAE